MREAPSSPMATGTRFWPGPEDWRKVCAATQRPPIRAATRAPIPEAFERIDMAGLSRPLIERRTNGERPGPGGLSTTEPSAWLVRSEGPLSPSVTKVQAVMLSSSISRALRVPLHTATPRDEVTMISGSPSPSRSATAIGARTTSRGDELRGASLAIRRALPTPHGKVRRHGQDVELARGIQIGYRCRHCGLTRETLEPARGAPVPGQSVG